MRDRRGAGAVVGEAPAQAGRTRRRHWRKLNALRPVLDAKAVIADFDATNAEGAGMAHVDEGTFAAVEVGDEEGVDGHAARHEFERDPLGQPRAAVPALPSLDRLKPQGLQRGRRRRRSR